MSGVLGTAVLLLAVASAVAAAGAVDVYCKLIDAQIPGRVSYPNSSVYDESITSYYSGQEKDLSPGCIFSPQATAEVAQFIKLVTAKQGGCAKPPQFAIRSGGHTIWTGAANVDGGITVDMRAMNSVELRDGNQVVSIGTGGIWSDIYEQLMPYNVTVMGGRVQGIGVGGLATGGGINYFSRRNGWVCDNIYDYEVVLANGEVVNANADVNSDLWLALKGGSNNFGIVTRIDAPTWPIKLMFGGGLNFAYTQEVLDGHAKAFSDFMNPANFDDAADMGMALVFQSPSTYVVGDSLYYVEPIESPPAYQEFFEIPGQLQNMTGLENVSYWANSAVGTLPPETPRAIDIVYSFKNSDASLYSELFKTWEDGTKALANVEGLQLVLLIQPHPVTNGTNSLGLAPGGEDLVMNVLTAAYANKTDDDIVQKGMEAVVATHEELLRAKGLYIPYQYLNYADKSQDPIRSYGPDVKARLQEASKKYDPTGVFQTQVPGGFKLFN